MNRSMQGFKWLVLLVSVLLLVSCAGLQQRDDVAWQQKVDQLDEDIRAATESGAKWSSYGSLGSGTIADADTFMVLDQTASIQKQYTYANFKTDISNFDEFGFPYGTNPTTEVNAIAEAALDSSDDQLLVYGGALRVFTYKHRECFTLEDPTDSDVDVPIFSHEDGITITQCRCIIDAGTNVIMNLSDGTNNVDSLTCTTSGVTDSSLSNNTFVAEEQIEFDISSTSGTVNWVNFCFTYTITRE